VVAKMQLFFNSLEGYGWSETYHWGPTVDPLAFTPTVITLVGKRCAWLTKDCQMVRLRLGTAFKRDPIIYDTDAYTTSVGAINDTQNNSDNALMVRGECPGVGYNRNFCRGVPDSFVSGDEFLPDAIWTNAFNAWIAYVLTPGFFQIVASVDNPQTPVAVASLVPSSPKGIQMSITQVGPSPLTGQVRITGASVFGYNGIKTITSGPTGTLAGAYLLGGAKPQAPNSVSDRIFATPVVPRQGDVKQYFFERFTTRKAGRPFGLRRGRARTVLSQRP